MAKTKTSKNTKSTKKAKKDCGPNYKAISIFFCIVSLLMAGGLVYCSFNLKTAKDKEYLALQEHLLSRHIEYRIDEGNARIDLALANGEELDYYKNVCEVVDHGLSQDHEVMVRYRCWDYEGEAETYKVYPESEKHYTLYFQRSEVNPGGYAEALGIGQW